MTTEQIKELIVVCITVFIVAGTLSIAGIIHHILSSPERRKEKENEENVIEEMLSRNMREHDRRQQEADSNYF